MLVQFLISFAAAALAVGFLRLLTNGKKTTSVRLDRDLEPIAFLFKEQRLLDATVPARALLAALPGNSEWQRLIGWLAMRLPESSINVGALERSARIVLTGQGGLRVKIENLGDGHLRMTLVDPQAESAGIVVDSLTLAAMEQELQILRSTMDHSPMLAWRQDAQGHVTWANSAYLMTVEDVTGSEAPWPLPRLFELGDGPKPVSRRVQVLNDTKNRWYDCRTHEIAGQTVAMALPADATVRAERSLREFVQTLTKTFADLPIGLAIFDRERKLQLFNPALIDLTGLATGFLTSRPTLFAFLDRLREARMVPEPKDFRSWRQQMNSLEAAASSGRHVETWSLPGGQTYRVTGRPHPDGAVAFLFEDITSEISLTRKFRSELSLGGDVFDALDAAIIVFGANGDVLLSNRRFTEVWEMPAGETLDDQLAHWDILCDGSPGFGVLRTALSKSQTDQVLGGAVRAPSGGLLSWRLCSLSGGRLLLTFQPVVSVDTDLAAEENPSDAMAASDLSG
ncbi:PAS-domain containing protein [Paracoccus aestuariivivens]|uniref:PAS domain-containing protein n=1 Tax=Paracoccus aestuariivivens TaxID=1820333 RepID=A0A6L6JE88_9RHOB|nr:PAS-domain containing protein [Paracoccus aestuariivivens]MTH78231.1 PAS domain-containing protein [Paracoccus aestuariivivens]